MDKLPVFEMVINENPESDVEVSFVALVDKPAIEKNFMAFNAQRLNFAINEERRIISGPAMVADSLIYRRDENGEYNVFFSKETIEQIALKFFKKDYQKNLNLFHDATLPLTNVTIFESFVSDKERGVQPMKGFEDLPDGSWFISAKVEDDIVWQKIKAGAVKGFSVEGIFSYVKKPKKKGEYDTLEDKIFELLSATVPETVLLNETEGIMTVKELIKKAKAVFDGTPLTPVAAATPAQPPVTPPVTPPAAPGGVFADYTLKDGTAVKCDKLEVGGVMMIGDVPAPAGEHELSDGTKVSVGDGGVIAAVTPGAAAAPVDPPLTMAAVTEAINKAINTFKEEMAAAKLSLKKAEDEAAKQKATLAGLFEIIEKIAGLPSANSLEDGKASFRTEFEKTKEERLKNLAKNLSTLKKVS